MVPSNSSGYLQLPPPPHINQPLYIHIYTHSRRPVLQVSFVLQETGEAGGRAGQMKEGGGIAAREQGWRAGTCDHCEEEGRGGLTRTRVSYGS